MNHNNIADRISKQTIGEIIDELIEMNICIWHKENPIHCGKVNDPTEKAKMFLESRTYSNKRVNLRYKIDDLLGLGLKDFKVNYYKGD